MPSSLAPLFAALFMIAAFGRRACTIAGAPEVGFAWWVVM